MFKVVSLKNASKFYKNAPSNLLKKLNQAFKFMQTNPFISNNIKILSGEYKDFRRYRVGDYRIIYEVDNTEKLIKVIMIEHRSKVYKML